MKYSLEIKEDPETKEAYIELPQRALKQLGWDVDTLLEWIDNEDGTYTLKEKTE
jgi:hypothetical protein